jgi:hypothetical protein
MLLVQASGFSGEVWAGLSPIIMAGIAAVVTWFVQKEQTWVGSLKGYVAQVAAVLAPAIVHWAAGASGFDFSTVETFAASVVGWLAVHLGVKAASANPSARY